MPSGTLAQVHAVVVVYGCRMIAVQPAQDRDGASLTGRLGDVSAGGPAGRQAITRARS